MRKTLQIAVVTVIWLLASPTLHLPDSAWLEVGAPPAIAHTVKPLKKVQKPLRRVVRSSAPIPPSVAPGLYPMQPVILPVVPIVTGSITLAPPLPGYPQVPTVPGLGRETSHDRISRCTHQAALGGLPSGQQGAYIHSCAFN
jgi:hypothetical protein